MIEMGMIVGLHYCNESNVVCKNHEAHITGSNIVFYITFNHDTTYGQQHHTVIPNETQLILKNAI